MFGVSKDKNEQDASLFFFAVLQIKISTTCYVVSSGGQVERRWLVPVVCAAVVFVVLAVVFALKKRILLRKRPFQCKLLNS